MSLFRYRVKEVQGRAPLLYFIDFTLVFLPMLYLYVAQMGSTKAKNMIYGYHEGSTRATPKCATE
jgi:hypothetical protein